MSKPAVALARTQLSTDSAAPVTSAQRRLCAISRQPWLDLNDKSVLVTGGTGSFGKHFLKTVIARYKPRRLIIFSRDELKQFEMAQDFPIGEISLHPLFHRRRARPRPPRPGAARRRLCRSTPPRMKQVTTAEYNPFECIRTNVFGAENVVYAACAATCKQGDRAVDRQGRQSGQSLWRVQACLRQDFRRRQQSGRRRRHALLGGALRQCVRLARLGRALLQQADRPTAPTACRSPTRA